MEKKITLTSFADPKKSNQNNFLLSCLSDIGCDPEEMKSWGKIGSLTEAIQSYNEEQCEGCSLDDTFLQYVRDLPVGSTPRPEIRRAIQKEPHL